MSPLIDLLSMKARQAGLTTGVRHTVVWFLLSKILLLMVQPRQINDVWVNKALSYIAMLGHLLPRCVYYALNQVLQRHGTLLIEPCNSAWASLWVLGPFVCGDETVVPRTGGVQGLCANSYPKNAFDWGNVICISGCSGGIRYQCVSIQGGTRQTTPCIYGAG